MASSRACSGDRWGAHPPEADGTALTIGGVRLRDQHVWRAPGECVAGGARVCHGDKVRASTETGRAGVQRRFECDSWAPQRTDQVRCGGAEGVHTCDCVIRQDRTLTLCRAEKSQDGARRLERNRNRSWSTGHARITVGDWRIRHPILILRLALRPADRTDTVRTHGVASVWSGRGWRTAVRTRVHRAYDAGPVRNPDRQHGVHIDGVQ